MVKKYLGTLDGSLVTPFPGEKGIVLTPSEDVTLNVGDTETVTAKDEDGNDIDVKWTSSNPDVATVDENGKITAVGPGTTTITATDDNGNEQSIEVTVVAENVGVNPEFSVNVETEGDKATVTVDVTNKEEVEKYSKIKGYNFAVVKIPTGPNQSAQTIKTVKSEEPTYTFEDLEDGAYQVVVTVSTEKGAHKTVAKAFSINNSNDDGLTTDKTKAVAYAQYVKPEDGSTSDYLYFTSVQSAVNYVKNNVIKDNRQHVAGIGLLKDVTESIVIDDEINTHINFNLNGHTLTGAKAGNTITINTYNMQFNVNNHEFNLENEEENSNNKKTTGGINASGAEGDNCVYLAGENVIFTVYEHMIFRGLTNSGAAIKAAQDTTTVIRVYDTTWEAPNATCLFIDDLGNGGIIISDGTYKGYINIIKQAGDGNITIGAESQVISETEPEKATPRFEAHDSIINAPNSTINFNYGYLTQRTLDVNNFKLRKDAYLYKTASVAYYIRLKEGQTLNEKAAVAELLPEGSLYETVQGAVNAADGHGAVRLLKDVTESVVIPENKNIQLDLNEKTLTGAEDKMYTINVLGDLEVTSKDSATKGKIIRTQTTAGLETPNKNDIVATNILLEGNGNVKVLDNVELHEEVGGGADIANLGSGNITIDGAYLFAGEQGVNTIRDFGNGGNIYVFSGELSGGAINKRNSGNVYIGKDSNPVSGIEGVQEKILLQDTTPQKLIIEGGGQANHAIDLGEDVQLYYYNGEIKGAINVTKEPVLRSTDRIVRGSENRGLHYETLAEGELPISYSKLYSADQVVLEEAVVYMQDNTELFYSTNYYRYFSSLQAAINVEPHRTEELREDEELVTVKINDINLNKDITESVVVPENKRVVLHLNAHTIVGADDKPYTINVLGKLDINKEGGRIVRNDSSTGNSEISNILLEKTGDLKVYKDAREGEIELILNTRGANIRNKGTGNITIEGHNVKIYDTLESDEGSDEDNGTYGIYDEGTGNIIVDGKISAFTAIRKENSGNIYIGKNDSIVSESNPYIRGFKCIEANPNCHVYYYSGMLGRVYAPKNTSRLDNSARVCQDLQGNQLNFAGVRSDFGEQCGINCAWDGPAINKTTEGETTAGYDVISYYHITQTSEVSLDTEVVNAGNDAVSDIVNN